MALTRLLIAQVVRTCCQNLNLRLRSGLHWASVATGGLEVRHGVIVWRYGHRALSKVPVLVLQVLRQNLVVHKSCIAEACATLVEQVVVHHGVL